MNETTKPEPRPFDGTVSHASELEVLRHRVRWCETADESEKMALIRALQEIAEAVGLSPTEASPRQTVEAVRLMANND